MIYDYIDLTSKVGIVVAAQNWLNEPVNVQVLKGCCREYNIFGKGIPINMEDADLVRMLALIGCGVIFPDITGKETGFALRTTGWEIPAWTFNFVHWKNLALHIEQMLEANGERDRQSLPACLLKAALDRFHVEHMLKSVPQPPNTDMQIDMALQQELMYDTGEFNRQWRKAVRKASKHTSLWYKENPKRKLKEKS